MQLLCRQRNFDIQALPAANHPRPAGRLERALRFAYKALYYDEQPECYWEVFQSRVALGQMEDARKTLKCMEHFVRGLNVGAVPTALAWQARISAARGKYFA